MIFNEYKCVGRWISFLYRQFQVIINQEMKAYDINSAEYTCLINISPGETVNQKHFSDVLLIDNSIVTRSLKSLEQKGFVLREKSANDRREMQVKLTATGIKAQESAKTVLKKWTDSMFSDISQEQKDMLIEMLAQMSNNIMKLTGVSNDSQ